MHANGPVHAVVYDYEEDLETVTCCCCQLLPVHHEAAVPGEADDGAFGSDDLGRHRCGHAVAHGTAGGCQLSVQSGVAMEPMNPYGIVAGAVGDDGVGREAVGQEIGRASCGERGCQYG